MCYKDQATITDPESGEIICSNCGIVICERIEDTIHQKRCAYSSEEMADKRDRTGAPTSLALHDMGLYTIIGRDNRDASGQVLGTAMVLLYQILVYYNSKKRCSHKQPRAIKHMLCS
jgi:transcription initiation factor TFIIB